MVEFKSYRGFIVRQAEEINHHFMLYSATTDDVIAHVPYEGDLLTQAEAEEKIDAFILLLGKIPAIYEDLKKQEAIYVCIRRTFR